MRYRTCCVESTAALITPMVEAARDITRRRFLKHVDRAELREVERMLGYYAHHSQGLTMAGDYHVSYHRSVFGGHPCYYFRWSAIEYIFTN